MALHLAQLNVATLRHPIDAAETADFKNALDPVKLDYFDRNGPSVNAFEFGQQFPEVATSLPQ